MRHQVFPLWVFLFPLLVVGIGYAIAFTRKGSVAGASVGSRRLDVHSPASPEQVFERLRVIGGKFLCDDSDASSKIIVLSSPVTFFSWGFLYPVFIHAEGAGSRIEIGIKSKFIQFGPVVGKWHRDCAAAIEQALSVPPARVA
jgi:hypothetical protein